MSSKLFDAWTWSRKLPEPFESIGSTPRNDIQSKYNKTRAAKSTLHSSTLSGIFAYMDLEIDPTSAKGAIGTQTEKIIAEYPSHRVGETHVTVFNRNNGKFMCAVMDSSGMNTNYVLKEDGNSGSALFFALMPYFLEDEEFSDCYTALLKCKKDGFTDMPSAEDAAYLLCDNVYRRIEGASTLGDSGVKISVQNNGNIQPLTALNIKSNVYSPTSVLLGNFEILKAGASPVSVSVYTKPEDFAGKYSLTERQFSAEEQSQIPTLPGWYVIPQEVVKICRHAQATTTSSQPMRNFMMRGPAGTGKTEGAKAIAAGLGLPYVHLTCSANTEIYDLLGQMLPDVDGASTPAAIPSELPSFDDIRFDPASAYEKLTGTYDEEITEDAVYDKLLEVIHQKTLYEMIPEREGKKDSHQRFRYVDTPLVQAMRNGWVVEIQEPTVISNPGVLVGLNSLLDRCAAITLPTGEKIRRHPDTVVVITTNNDYAGCKNMNQSVISRMNLVIDMDEPDAETLTRRVMNITGCTDNAMVRKMAETVKDISERCRETMITDGCCGVRELISWVQSYMICNDAMEAAKYTVLASVSSDPENRQEIENTCLQPKFT